MIKENVNVSVLGTGITSMILYRSVVKIYINSLSKAGIPDSMLSGASTRHREIALFMLMGAPEIAGSLMVINPVTAGGTKVPLNIAGNNELEGTGTSSTSSSSSLFLFLNKLPS